MKRTFKRYEIFNCGIYSLIYFSIKSFTSNSTLGFFCRHNTVLIKFYSKRQVQRFNNFLLYLQEKDYDIAKIFDDESMYFFYFAPEYIRTAKKYNTQVLFDRLEAVRKKTIETYKAGEK